MAELSKIRRKMRDERVKVPGAGTRGERKEKEAIGETQGLESDGLSGV